MFAYHCWIIMNGKGYSTDEARMIHFADWQVSKEID